MDKFIVGITGASGSIYGKRICEELINHGKKVYLVATEYGKKVFEYECEISFESWLKELGEHNEKIELCDIKDMFSNIASGSFKTKGMVIAPCSMGTLSKIANGISDSLLIRAADVMIKEKRKLILIPRETPLNSIHLQNMLTLSNVNVEIVPPMPAFYQRPKTIEDLVNSTVGRVLDMLGVENVLYSPWGTEE